MPPSRIGRRVAVLLFVVAVVLTMPVAAVGTWRGAAGVSADWPVLATLGQLLIGAVVLAVIFNRTIARHLQSLYRAAGSDARGRAGRSRGAGDVLDQLADLLEVTRAESAEAHQFNTRRLSELANLNEKLSDVYREQLRFDYSLSHDLKAPTNTIGLLLAELREITSERQDPEAMRILDELFWLTERLEMLILRLTRSAIATADDQAEEEIDLEEMLRELIRDSAAAIRPGGADIHLRDLPIVRGKVFQIRTLFRNLLSNALKFYVPGRPPRIDIFGSPGPALDWVQVTVRDNGVGIPQSEQGSIFEMFSQQKVEGDFKAAGLGLALCQRNASGHGGWIELQSEPGSGSSFDVTLPGRGKSDQAALPAPAILGAPDARVLRFGVNMMHEHLWTRAARGFAADLAETSRGRLQCLVMGQRRAPGSEDVLQKVRNGAMDIAFVPATDIAELAPDFGCLFAPFLADDLAHSSRILGSPQVQSLEAQLPEKVGVVGAGFGSGGMRTILCRSPVVEPQDLTQLRIRTPCLVPVVDFFRQITPDVIPMGLHDAFDGFARGRVDATDMDLEMAIRQPYREHTSTLILSYHTSFPYVAVLSQELWASCSPGDRDLLQQLLRKHSDGTLESYQKAEVRFLQAMREGGLAIRRLDREFFEPAIRGWTNIWHHRSTALDTVFEAAEATREAPATS